MDKALYEEMWRTENEHWWFVARRRIVERLVQRYAPPPPWRICEIGCGTGGNLATWSNEHEVVGIDASEHALQFARRRLGDRVLYGRLPGPLPVENGSCQVVLSTDVFEHVEEDRDSARAALELLSPGGILVATVPAYQWLFSPRDRHHHHFRRYGKQQFAELFDVPGCKLELLRRYNSSLFPLAAAARLWSKYVPAEHEAGDVRVPPRPLNGALRELFAAERHFLPWVPPPWGLSLLAVVRREHEIEPAIVR